MKVLLLRTKSTDQGTFGRLLYNDKIRYYTLEPPWRNNEKGVSCIPEGEYKAVWHHSPKYGWCYLITGVPNRSFILVHPGNFGGDVFKGYRTHTKGCILVGTRRGILEDQEVILASKSAVKKLFKELEEKDFVLKVANIFQL